MTALLELPQIRDRVHRLTVEDYHRLSELGIISEKTELLRGIVINRMSKSPLHEYVAQKLVELLFSRVPPGFVIRSERPLTFRDSEPEPDISIVKGAPEDWLTRHPATAQFVIEVSLTSLEIDQTKAEIYAEAGIPEYWLIRPEARIIEVFQSPAGSAYQLRVTVAEGEIVRAMAVPGLEVRPREVFPRS